MQESNQSRQELLQEVEKVRGYFSNRTHNYHRLSWYSIHYQKYKRGPHKAPLIIGLILLGIMWIVTLMFVNVWGAVAVYGGIPAAILLIPYIIKRIVFPIQTKKYLQQCIEMMQPLQQYYHQYHNCPICFEYVQPECLTMLCDIITTGRADTWKEAISVASMSTQKKRKNLLTITTASTNPNATPEDLIEAYANVYSLFSNPKK